MAMKPIYHNVSTWLCAEVDMFNDDPKLWVFVGEGFEDNSAKLLPADAVHLLREMADAIETWASLVPLDLDAVGVDDATARRAPMDHDVIDGETQPGLESIPTDDLLITGPLRHLFGHVEGRSSSLPLPPAD